MNEIEPKPLNATLFQKPEAYLELIDLTQGVEIAAGCEKALEAARRLLLTINSYDCVAAVHVEPLPPFIVYPEEVVSE